MSKQTAKDMLSMGTRQNKKQPAEPLSRDTNQTMRHQCWKLFGARVGIGILNNRCGSTNLKNSTLHTTRRLPSRIHDDTGHWGPLVSIFGNLETLLPAKRSYLAPMDALIGQPTRSMKKLATWDPPVPSSPITTCKAAEGKEDWKH